MNETIYKFLYDDTIYNCLIKYKFVHVIHETEIIILTLIEQHKFKKFRELNIEKNKVDKTFIIKDEPKCTNIDLINLVTDNKKKNKPSNANNNELSNSTSSEDDNISSDDDNETSDNKSSDNDNEVLNIQVLDNTNKITVFFKK